MGGDPASSRVHPRVICAGEITFSGVSTTPSPSSPPHSLLQRKGRSSSRRTLYSLFPNAGTAANGARSPRVPEKSLISTTLRDTRWSLGPRTRGETRHPVYSNLARTFDSWGLAPPTTPNFFIFLFLFFVPDVLRSNVFRQMGHRVCVRVCIIFFVSKGVGSWNFLSSVDLSGFVVIIKVELLSEDTSFTT